MSDNIDYEHVLNIVFEDGKARRKNTKRLSVEEKTLVAVISSKYPRKHGGPKIDDWLANMTGVCPRTIRKVNKAGAPDRDLRRMRKGVLTVHEKDWALLVCLENPRMSNRGCRRVLREEHEIFITRETFRRFRGGCFLKRTLK
jgi:hypothetical protein